MQLKMLNLACGNSYVVDEGWTNVDFESNVKGVLGLNLLEPTPFEGERFDLIYSSHFFEHLPQQQILPVLKDWFRILRPEGVLRLVLPDCEEMFTEYLRQRQEGNHLFADFVIAEIIDQCVRTFPGGRIGHFYEQSAIAGGSDSSRLASYITARNGENFSYFKASGAADDDQTMGGNRKKIRGLRNKFSGILRGIIDRSRLKILYSLYGKAFVEQNVSFANIGEKHHWLWDFHQVSQILHTAGFISVTRVSHRTSAFTEFPFIPLDMEPDGTPRKGLESMYIEARKPT